VLVVQQPDVKIPGWPPRHSRDDPTLVFRECALQALVRRRRID
jgi:hypothetical protein